MHIVQRGNNRQPCFVYARDYDRYLSCLGNAASRYGAQIHAYTLMTNHVHILITPEEENTASRMMQDLGRSYVLYFNRLHTRTGTLWEGRFRSTTVASERYLFACYRYIELNPISAGLSQSPEQYRWSSYRANALGVTSKLVTPRQEYVDLGSTKNKRCRAYRKMFTEPDDEQIFTDIHTRVS